MNVIFTERTEKKMDERILLAHGRNLMKYMPCAKEGVPASVVYVCLEQRMGKEITPELKCCAERVVTDGGIPVFPYLMYDKLYPSAGFAEAAVIRTMTLLLLTHCDEVRVFGKTITASMLDEICVAKALKIPVRFMDLDEEDEEETHE
jgi:hypothetical protein